jgi:hypothetical protein
MNHAPRKPVAAAFLLLLLAPGMGRAAAVNDCLIVAAKAQYDLPPGTWSRLLVVRYGGNALQHVYLVYGQADGALVAFDGAYGTRRLATAERDPNRLARLVDPFAQSGWFVEDNAGQRPLASR